MTNRVMMLIGLLVSLTPCTATQAASRNTKLLADAIYFESRGEPELAQRLVADSVLNRVAKSGKSILHVISQAHQYPWFRRTLHISDHKAYDLSVRIADNEQSHQTNRNVTFFYNTKRDKVNWSHLGRSYRVGHHTFVEAPFPIPSRRS